MYICTDQLGLESEFDIKVIPDGKLHIDGFIVCFDVSIKSPRVIEDQVILWTTFKQFKSQLSRFRSLFYKVA